MNPSEWSSFIGNIETGCRFSLPLSCNMRVSICDTNIIFRYYKDKDKINYIISNDDRRNIVKYLKNTIYIVVPQQIYALIYKSFGITSS